MERYLFNQVTDSPYEVLKFVHPLQQRYVHEIISRANTIPEISALILFGSSIDNYCTSDSDLDVMIITEAEVITEELEKSIRINLRNDILKPMDLLIEPKEIFIRKIKTENLYKQIYKEGLVIYSKYMEKECN